MEFKLDLGPILKLADEFARSYADLVIQEGHKVHEDGLVASQAKVEFDGQYLTIYLDAPREWEVLEEGVKPHFPPVSAILKWVQDKGVFPNEDHLLIAWAISKNMAKVGVHSRNSLHVEPDKPFAKTQLMSQIKNKVLSEINRQMAEHIKSQFTAEYNGKN